MTPGELIRSLRRQHGYTLHVLAAFVTQATGEPLSKSAVSKWELDHNPPSYRHCVVIDELLGAGGAILGKYNYPPARVSVGLLERLEALEARVALLETFA